MKMMKKAVKKTATKKAAPKKAAKKMVKERKTGEMYSSPKAKRMHEMKEGLKERMMEYGSKRMGM
jgi:hypothetical protein